VAVAVTTAVVAQQAVTMTEMANWQPKKEKLNKVKTINLQ